MALSSNNLKLLNKRRAIESIWRHITEATTACETRADVNDEKFLARKRHVRPIPRTHYGGRHTVTLLPGTGIGPELMSYVKEIFKHTGAPVDFEEIGMDAMSQTDCDLNDAVCSILRNGVALKSNINPCGYNCATADATNDNVTTNNAMLRKKLELFVNTVHCRSFVGLPQRHDNVDIVVVRQNTEGEYAMLEHEAVKGVVESMKVVTRVNAERVIRYAFETAVLHNRKKVTTVHKANIMKLSDGYFLDISREIAKDYPTIVHDDMIVDAACMRLISEPKRFDVILTTNLYGSIVSNVLCATVGGGGLVSGKDVGVDCACFEPATRSADYEIAGRDIANPIAMLNAAADMLDHLGRDAYAGLIRNGIEGCIMDNVRTKDLGGEAKSSEVVGCILGHIDREMKR